MKSQKIINKIIILLNLSFLVFLTQISAFVQITKEKTKVILQRTNAFENKTISASLLLPLIQTQIQQPTPVVKKNSIPKTPHHDIIIKKAIKYKVNPKLITSIISHESKWKVKARGKSNDMGLMQVLIINMTKQEQEKPFDPEINIEAGTRYLKKCLNKYKELNKSISCYNRGLNGKYNPEYVNAVLKYW